MLQLLMVGSIGLHCHSFDYAWVQCSHGVIPLQI